MRGMLRKEWQRRRTKTGSHVKPFPVKILRAGITEQLRQRLVVWGGGGVGGLMAEVTDIKRIWDMARKTRCGTLSVLREEEHDMLIKQPSHTLPREINQDVRLWAFLLSAVSKGDSLSHRLTHTHDHTHPGPLSPPVPKSETVQLAPPSIMTKYTALHVSREVSAGSGYFIQQWVQSEVHK